jgi:hypothetical protein
MREPPRPRSHHVGCIAMTDNPPADAMREVSAEDRKHMGTAPDAKAALIEKVRAWRETRQPSMDTASVHKKRDASEHELRFQLATAALLWLWHEENPAALSAARTDRDGWRPIETAPRGDDDFFLVCGVDDPRSPFVVRGQILWSARKPNTPSHLHLHYLTHWMPLPAPPLPSAPAPLEGQGK